MRTRSRKSLAAGYDVPGPQDVDVMPEMKVIISHKEGV
jgi:hypothetical protein